MMPAHEKTFDKITENRAAVLHSSLFSRHSSLRGGIAAALAAGRADG
jgi:hypothetical protein